MYDDFQIETLPIFSLKHRTGPLISCAKTKNKAPRSPAKAPLCCKTPAKIALMRARKTYPQQSKPFPTGP